MYVGTHACMYACMHVCMCIYEMYAYSRQRLYIHMCVVAHTYIHVDVHVYIYMYIYLFIDREIYALVFTSSSLANMQVTGCNLWAIYEYQLG